MPTNRKRRKRASPTSPPRCVDSAGAWKTRKLLGSKGYASRLPNAKSVRANERISSRQKQHTGKFCPSLDCAASPRGYSETIGHSSNIFGDGRQLHHRGDRPHIEGESLAQCNRRACRQGTQHTPASARRGTSRESCKWSAGANITLNEEDKIQGSQRYTFLGIVFDHDQVTMTMTRSP
jgi:hypothetical protein